MLFVLAVYILNIQTGGDCQFGPRYLLPAMPFSCLGIAGYSYLSTNAERRLASVIVLLLGVVSLVINLVGAVQGAMGCPDGRNAFRNQLARLAHGNVNYFPLAPWLLAPVFMCAVLLVLSLWQSGNPRSHFMRKT
jgi:hypothetical protein